MLQNLQKTSLDKYFCFRFGAKVFIFCLYGKARQIKKTKRESREEVKKPLLDSMIIDENLEFDDLNKEAGEYKTRKKQQK